MPLTYQDVMTTQLHMLTDAAKAWRQMGNRFGKLKTNFEDHVLKVTGDGSWRGEGFQAATSASGIIKHEYGAAKAEALAIAQILNEAYEQFHDFKQAIDEIVKEAKSKNYKVNASSGEVKYDWDSLTPEENRAIKNDPENGRLIAKAERDFTSSIKKLVKKVDDADHGVKLALTAAVTDTDGKGSLNGFNSAAEGDMEKVEAKRASELATKLDSEGKLPPREIAEMRRLARDNSDDTAFSRTLLNSLGPQGTIEFTNNLNMAARDSDSGNKSGYLAIEKGLAISLGTATKDTDSTFYKKWREEMKKVGVQRFDDALPSSVGQKASQVRGYQSMLTLMEQGDPKSFSSEMLQDLGHDIRAAEDPDKGGDPDIWDLPGTHSGKSDGWFANDPLDSTLGIMSHQPDAATEFLDPGPDKKNDMLHYLVKDRDWNLVDTSDWSGNVERTGKDTFDGDVKTGLGLALEAGTTGREPASPGTEIGRHSEAQARIMHDTINLLDYGNPSGKDGDEDRVGNADNVLKADDNANIRGPLTRAMASYAPDMVDIIAGDGPGGRVGEAHSLTNGGDSEIQNSRSSIVRMMRGVSEDSENYFLLRRSEQAYMNEQLATEDFSSIEDVKNRAAKIGEVSGAVNAVGGDLDLSERDLKLAEKGDQRVYGYHVVGGLVTGVPIVGDIAQRSVDAYWHEWLKGVSGEEGLLAREKLSSGNDAAGDSLDTFFRNWGDADQRSGSEVSAAQREARQSYVGGRELAFDALRERK